MKKETMMTNKGIDFYIKEMNESKKSPLFKALQNIDIEIMDEFSQWIHDNKWSKNNNNALWFHYKKMYENLKFSEVYQLFLEDKKM
jgi:hypothetical protein